MVVDLINQLLVSAQTVIFSTSNMNLFWIVPPTSTNQDLWNLWLLWGRQQFTRIDGNSFVVTSLIDCEIPPFFVSRNRVFGWLNSCVMMKNSRVFMIHVFWISTKISSWIPSAHLKYFTIFHHLIFHHRYLNPTGFTIKKTHTKKTKNSFVGDLPACTASATCEAVAPLSAITMEPGATSRRRNVATSGSRHVGNHCHTKPQKDDIYL